MLVREDCMPVSFLKLEKYTGSTEGERFRMEMVKPGEDADPVLHVTVWPEPFAYDFTPDDRKISKDFSFDEKGIAEGIAWINAMQPQVAGK